MEQIYCLHLIDNEKLDALLKFAQIVKDKLRSQPGFLSSGRCLAHVYIDSETSLLS